MSKLSANRRNSLDDNKFGVSSLRKFPLTDREHTLKAIQFFHHCPPEHKQELAHKINNASKKYGITITDKSKIYDYLNEDEKLEIDNFSEIYALEESLWCLNEGIMSEQDAQGYINTAKNAWKKRKAAIQNSKDKNKLLLDLKAESTALHNLVNSTPPDFYGVILRAKDTSTKMGAAGVGTNNMAVNHTRSPKYFSRANSTIYQGAHAAKIVGGVALAGAALGGISAARKGNGKAGTIAKVGTGLAAGAAVGAAAGAVGFKKNLHTREKGIAKAMDNRLPLRGCAESYINFITNMQSEVATMDPFENVKNAKEQQAAQQGGEG